MGLVEDLRIQYSLLCIFVTNCLLDVAADEQLLALELETRNSNEAKLRLSFDKLGRLLHNLRSNQFASFTE